MARVPSLSAVTSMDVLCPTSQTSTLRPGREASLRVDRTAHVRPQILHPAEPAAAKAPREGHCAGTYLLPHDALGTDFSSRPRLSLGDREIEVKQAWWSLPSHS